MGGGDVCRTQMKYLRVQSWTEVGLKNSEVLGWKRTKAPSVLSECHTPGVSPTPITHSSVPPDCGEGHFTLSSYPPPPHPWGRMEQSGSEARDKHRCLAPCCESRVTDAALQLSSCIINSPFIFSIAPVEGSATDNSLGNSVVLCPRHTGSYPM